MRTTIIGGNPRRGLVQGKANGGTHPQEHRGGGIVGTPIPVTLQTVLKTSLRAHDFKKERRQGFANQAEGTQGKQEVATLKFAAQCARDNQDPKKGAENSGSQSINFGCPDGSILFPKGIVPGHAFFAARQEVRRCCCCCSCSCCSFITTVVVQFLFLKRRSRKFCLQQRLYPSLDFPNTKIIGNTVRFRLEMRRTRFDFQNLGKFATIGGSQHAIQGQGGRDDETEIGVRDVGSRALVRWLVGWLVGWFVFDGDNRDGRARTHNVAA